MSEPASAAGVGCGGLRGSDPDCPALSPSPCSLWKVGLSDAAFLTLLPVLAACANLK